MDTLLHVGLMNAAVACVLALAAVAVGRVYRRPAVLHALWLLVLLKLLTPPLWDVPVPRLTAAALIGYPAAEPELPALPSTNGSPIEWRWARAARVGILAIRRKICLRRTCASWMSLASG